MSIEYLALSFNVVRNMVWINRRGKRGSTYRGIRTGMMFLNLSTSRSLTLLLHLLFGGFLLRYGLCHLEGLGCSLIGYVKSATGIVVGM
jgi:hypothetical protein